MSQQTGRIINTWRDPYGAGFSTCRPKQITIQPGLTVLVGCNGAGKTTLIQNIQSELKNNNIPCEFYNNLSEGGKETLGTALYEGNIELANSALCSSEGENISLNIGNQFAKFSEFIQTGRITSKATRIADLFHEYKIPETKERWLLFDAIDSGYSIDNVIDCKWIFNDMIQNATKAGYKLYIIVSANEYELAHETPCMDVTNGKYMTFPTYESFRKFILESRKKKDKRYERLAQKAKKEGNV